MLKLPWLLVTTLTRNEDNTNSFMHGVWFKNCGQPTIHKHQRWTKYMSPVYLFKCTPMSLVTKATIHKDEQCWLYKRPLYWFKCTPMYLPPMPSRGSPIQNLLWPNWNAELTASVNSAPTRERGFSHTIRHGSQDTGEINFVVSSITMYNMWCMLWHNMLY
jgi:hypothetical protein